jgi:hypothetical protein
MLSGPEKKRSARRESLDWRFRRLPCARSIEA